MAQQGDNTCIFCQRVTTSRAPGSEVIWEFPQSVVVLGAWQYFEGYCIVLSRQHVPELFELESAVRHAFVDEIAVLGKALATLFEPRKLNVEMLGNQVPHLHCHLFPRYQRDPDHLKPAWVAIDRAETDSAERRRLEGQGVNRDQLRQRIRAELTHVTSS
jgi:diadenosine tetraphosphate (Ap4A) HIT family hydrolase